jgi:hypothetical protein
LESIRKFLVEQCDCTSLTLCRFFLADDPLAHGLVGGPVNHFVAHTLIQHADADVERVRAGVIGATLLPSSPYACPGHPIQGGDQLTQVMAPFLERQDMNFSELHDEMQSSQNRFFTRLCAHLELAK